PGFGGPFYFFQNVFYNQATGALTGAQCTGILYYQNTIVGETNAPMMNEHFLNNIFIASGANGRGGLGAPLGPTFAVNTITNYSTSDYNGFRIDPRAAVAFEWNSPPTNLVADFDLSHPTVKRRFKTLQE